MPPTKHGNRRMLDRMILPNPFNQFEYIHITIEYADASKAGSSKSIDTTHLEVSEQPVILGVSPDPEPDYGTVFHPSDGSIGQSDSRRVQRPTTAHPLKLQTGMVWICFEHSIRINGLPLHIFWKPPISLPESPSRDRPHA